MVNIQELQHKQISEIIEALGIPEGANLANVDLTKLAYTLNVSVLPKDFEGTKIEGEKVICAFVTNNKGNSCIFYSDNLLSNKARIMIAQSFAKYIITGNNSFFVTHSTNFSRREKMLTNEMLMPESQVKDVICKLILPTTFSLAEIFQVTQEFVRQRLDEMEVETSIAGYNF